MKILVLPPSVILLKFSKVNKQNKSYKNKQKINYPDKGLA